MKSQEGIKSALNIWQSPPSFKPCCFNAVQALEANIDIIINQKWSNVIRALPDITVWSGSPANFQSPDSPKTGHSPSRTPDFYHLNKWEKISPKKSKKKFQNFQIFFLFFFFKIFFKFFFVFLFGLGTFDSKFVSRDLILWELITCTW